MKIIKIAFIVLLIRVLCFDVDAQTKGYLSDYRFNSISTNKGLLQSSVLSILQDNYGFVWMGTKYGLNKYDGYKLTSYKHNVNDSTSISYGEVINLSNDRNGDILIGTRGGGLNKYQYQSESFHQIKGIPNNATVYVISEEDDGSLWVGTDDGFFKGEYKNGISYDFENVNIMATFVDTKGKLRASNKLNHTISSIQRIDKNTLLVGTGGGLFYYNIDKNEYREIYLDEINNASITCMLFDAKRLYIGSSAGFAIIDSLKDGTIAFNHYGTKFKGKRHLSVDYINSLIKDDKGVVWAGTRGGGLLRVDEFGKITNYRGKAVEGYLGDDVINSLMIDRTGVLWIGTESRGCYTLDLNRKKFKHLEIENKGEFSIFNGQVTAVTGHGKELWIGTAANGLIKLSQTGEGEFSVEPIGNRLSESNQITNEIIALLADSKNDIWVGMPINELLRIDRNNRTTTYETGGFVLALHEDSHNNIWFGTWGGGIGKINPNGTSLIFNSSDNSRQALNNDIVLCLADDPSNNLWVGTKGGGLNIASIDILSIGESAFVNYSMDLNDESSISNNDITCIHMSKDGSIWVGTGNGLNKVVYPESKSGYQAILQGKLEFESYYEKDGLPNNVIQGISEDGSGNLWISTLSGLSKYNPYEKQFTNYTVNDGLSANEFHGKGFYCSANNEMFFGGVNGITAFNPDKITANPFMSNVVITSLKVFDIEAKPGMDVGGKVVLDESIAETKFLKLYPNHKEFSFEFSGMHYSNTQNVYYAYRLLGFNDEWRITKGSLNTATYTNIREGNYIFQVKATNNDGLWNDDVREVEIKIVAPLWRQPLVFVVYFIFIMILLFFFRKYSVIAVTERNELRFEAMERNKLKEMTESKMRFFTNISHEIRTPLTLIYSPLDKVVANKNLDKETRSTIQLVNKNVRRLLSLTDQLLQLRKMDIGILEPQYEMVNVINYMNDIIGYFENQAKRKNIKVFLVDESIAKDETLWIDKEMITTTLYNLLSNAFKYTKLDGEIAVQLKQVSKKDLPKGNIMNKKVENYLLVEVNDSGIGIAPAELSKIFYRFYQSSNKNSSEHAGSGVGLSIVKEYVELHKGQVGVASFEGKGTTMMVYLPMGDDHIAHALKKDLSVLTENRQIPEFINTYNENGKYIEVEEPGIDKVRANVLIVDDDMDMLNFLAEHFKHNYRVTTATNGKTAWGIIKKELPDLVLSDVMMPEIDGMALCKLIKNEVETSHIPVLLITAKVGNDNIIDGYSVGADRYISKPFSMNVLEAQVAQLLATRKYLIDLYSKKVFLKPKDITITSTDEKFLTQLMDVIEENLSDSDFDVAQMVDKMNMSHSAVLKKVKALTDSSLVDFVRRHRLNKAAMIFEKQKVPVSEVAYLVGFSDPKYFSKCFSKQFGKTPSEFIVEKLGE